MKKIIGKTHFYCGFCGKLYSKEDLNILSGRHINYELNMIEAGRSLIRELKKVCLSSTGGVKV